MPPSKQSDNLSGFWTGVYDYLDGYAEPVPFNAVIEDVAGALGGEIIEPNTFSDAKDRELFASISGMRQGDNVNFLKTYERVAQGGHSVAYQGTLDAARTKIEGTWSTFAGAQSWSGPFVMNRSSGKKEDIRVKEKAGRESEIVK